MSVLIAGSAWPAARQAARAWYHAAHLALYADPAMRYDIRHYLFTGHGWSLVRYDCNPDEGI